MSDPSKTALLLIGYQRDYFAEDGILHSVIEDCVEENRVLQHTLQLLDAVAPSSIPVVNLPILFSPDYHEIPNATGLLAKIREVGAFRRDTEGGKVIDEFTRYGDRITHLHGKTGFNAFLGTGLDDYLEERGVEEVVLAGVVTSVCIDSTGRAASELGYRVTILADASAGRSSTEHEFYCDSVFSLYGRVETTDAFLQRIGAAVLS